MVIFTGFLERGGNVDFATCYHMLIERHNRLNSNSLLTQGWKPTGFSEMRSYSLLLSRREVNLETGAESVPGFAGQKRDFAVVLLIV